MPFVCPHCHEENDIVEFRQIYSRYNSYQFDGSDHELDPDSMYDDDNGGVPDAQEYRCYDCNGFLARTQYKVMTFWVDEEEDEEEDI